MLLKIADRIEANLERWPTPRPWDNGKPIRETLNADIPLPSITSAISPAASAPRKARCERNRRKHRRLPLPRAAGRRRPDHSVELPDPDGCLETGACARRRQLRRAEAGRSRHRISILVLIELIADLLPPGILNIVNGYGIEAGKPLATSKRMPRSPSPGPLRPAVDHAICRQEPDPVTVELGGKSPNIFFADVMDAGRRLPRQVPRRPCCSRLQPGRSVHLPLARAWCRNPSTTSSSNAPGPREQGDQAGQSAGHRHHDRRPGLVPTSTRRSCPTSTSAAGRRQAADRRRAGAWKRKPAASTSNRRCSRATTRCAFSRKRSSGRCWP
jgi:hypothetical protein